MFLTVYRVTQFFIQPLKMDLTEGSETSAKLNLTPGKYPKENIQNNSKIFLCMSVLFNMSTCFSSTDTFEAVEQTRGKSLNIV
jgi:hypothetical protein